MKYSRTCCPPMCGNSSINWEKNPNNLLFYCRLKNLNWLFKRIPSLSLKARKMTIIFFIISKSIFASVFTKCFDSPNFTWSGGKIILFRSIRGLCLTRIMLGVLSLPIGFFVLNIMVFSYPYCPITNVALELWDLRTLTNRLLLFSMRIIIVIIVSYDP